MFRADSSSTIHPWCYTLEVQEYVAMWQCDQEIFYWAMASSKQLRQMRPPRKKWTSPTARRETAGNFRVPQKADEITTFSSNSKQFSFSLFLRHSGTPVMSS